MFVFRLGARFLPGGSDGLRIGVFARRPSEHMRAARLQDVDFIVVPAAGHAAGVGQKDDLRFESLGGMNGHDAYAIARRLHVALDRQIDSFEVGEKPCERKASLAFGAQREAQKFIDGVARLRPKPRLQSAPSALFAEQPRIEIEGRKRGAFAPAEDRRIWRLMACFERGAEGVEERAAASRRDFQEILVIEVRAAAT